MAINKAKVGEDYKVTNRATYFNPLSGGESQNIASTPETNVYIPDETDEDIVSGSVLIDTDWTTISATIISRFNETDINLEINNSNDSSSALSGFRIQLKDHVDGEWYVFLDSTAAGGDQFADDTLKSLILGDDALGTLAAGSTAHVIVRLWAAHAVRLQAKTASGTATVTARGTIKGGE